MKKLYLTSALGNYKKINGIRIACAMNNTNHIVDKLQKICDNNTNILLIASNPYDYAKNNNMKKIMEESFTKSNVTYNSMTIIDSRNENNLDIYLKQHQLIILLGGHLPTQNNWFNKLNLKNKIKSYDGYIIGQSAGSMNCANIVYAYPEYKEELDKDSYPRWLKGLDLTNILIFPHYEKYKEVCYGNIKVMEEVVFKDSFNKTLYVLNDGSYIEIDKNITICGECFKLTNGKLNKICSNKEILQINE